jgi:hypothetical protein
MLLLWHTLYRLVAHLMSFQSVTVFNNRLLVAATNRRLSSFSVFTNHPWLQLHASRSNSWQQLKPSGYLINSLTLSTNSSQLEIEDTLRLTVSQYVLVSGTRLGPMTRFYFFLLVCRTIALLFVLGRPLWREDGSVICNAICQFPLRRLLRLAGITVEVFLPASTQG